ncbi:MAG: transcription elongation factor GreA [Patescibacteria group bacterium]|nr:transcription elongation factor GreA [Patescibacteria group bacterium]
MNTTPAYLSEEKRKELEAELHNLKMVERKNIAEQLEYAKSLGDLSENAEYHEARDKQADIEDRISELEVMLKNAVIISTTGAKGKVNVGSKVLIQKDKGDKVEYQIVGSEEANAALFKISHQSPLGSVLLDKKKGDKVVVNTPKGDVQYTIVDIK